MLSAGLSNFGPTQLRNKQLLCSWILRFPGMLVMASRLLIEWRVLEL
jgi:hypothetical protein